jgi:pimeloyl-ACP methyl ester carboxylesterase
MEEARIEVGGRRLAWRVAGSGPPLLLVNGYAATGADWDPTFLAALAASHEVICPDNRGMGGSELGEDRLSVAAMAEDLEAILGAAGIGSCAVAGWSMGGFVAQRLAEARPDRVERLALIASDPGGPGAVPADPRDWGLLLDHSGSPREQATRLISLLFPPAEAATIDRQFGEVVAAAREALSPVSLRAQEEAMEGWHREERPPQHEWPPTLILHGEEDRVIPAANAPLLDARWRAEAVEVLPGCGHAAMAQQPEAIAARLREFFAAG